MERGRAEISGPSGGGARRRSGRRVMALLFVGALGVSARAMATVGAAASGGEGGRESFAELERELDSQDPEARRVAVGKLVRLGDERAWRAVLGALADPDGRVADRAQLVLADADERIVGDVLGRAGLEAREDSVRVRAAELVGRVKCPVRGEALVGGVSDRSAEVRRRVAWSIERLARAKRLAGDVAKKLVPAVRRKAASDRDPLVRGAMLFALDALDPELALAHALSALDDRREEVRMAAAWVAGTRDEHAAAIVRRLAHDPAPRVRSLLAEMQERRASPDAANSLVVLLEAEERLRLRWGIVEALRRLSGMHYRLDARPWRLWVDGLPQGWRPTPGAFVEAPREGATTAFAGMPLLSDRVAFLFDCSGSLWNRREDGLTRKEFADEALRRALSTLPEDALFNVIPYTDRPFPWSPRSVQASGRNVARALDYFEGCMESGTGDFYEAALLAMEDPDVDTIVVLTDGAPTGGEVWDLELIVPLLLERNRFRRMRFDSVLVDAPGGFVPHWKMLAERSGGITLSIEVK